MTDIDVRDVGPGTRLSARVEWNNKHFEPATIEFVFDGVGAESITTPGDALAASMLAPCAVQGERLIVDAPVSPALVRNMNRITSIWKSWMPRWHLVDVEAPAADPSSRRPTEVASCFSGGVDSYFTALKPREEPITTLVTLRGLYPEGFPDPDVIVPVLADAANALGKKHLVVYTDAYAYGRRFVPHQFNLVANLCAAVLAMGERVRRHHIPSSSPYWRLVTPYFTHPDTDQLWSTETLEVIHDAIEFSRNDKIRAIARSDVALQNLYICMQDRPDMANCRLCDKCQLTALVLHVEGVLERCPTLGPVTPESLKHTKVVAYKANFLEIRDAIEDPDLRRAVDIALRRSKLRAKVRPLGKLLRRLHLR